MQFKSTYLLGIDTGGTYTDAVVIDQGKHQILASAKAITTKGNLEIGVGEAMTAVLSKVDGGMDPASIALISLSTTLATNSVVEGHGSPVGLVLIGFDNPMEQRTGIAKAFPGMPILRVAGGHDHNGNEVCPLDLVDLVRQCEAVQGQVNAFAVASAFAVRNGAHELAAHQAITTTTGLPVTLSSEISSALDAPRRAMTATLNARLIGRISNLIAAVRRAAEKHGITCPLMIVKGDGTLALADAVAARPIETILSGPAASLIGAKWLSGSSDFVMSDMGGTTTDIGVLRDGRPQLAMEGALVGGWRTMVRAIDIKTIGLGGDSEVQIGLNGAISIAPVRAVPVSLLAHRHPEVVVMLEADLAETEGGSLLGKFVTTAFGASAKGNTSDLSLREAELMGLISATPMPLRHVAASSSAQRALQSLRRKGLIQYCTFTPSDAAHVLNFQANWTRQAAVLAAKIMSRFRTMKMPNDTAVTAFCEEVWSGTVAKSCRVILETVVGEEAASSSIATAVCEGRHTLGLARIMLSPAVPIVAVGGPVTVFYPEVAKRLQCDVRFAPFHDVANAVGSAVGQVGHVVEAAVEGDGGGQFRVHVSGETFLHGSGSAALADAVAKAEAAALAVAVAHGALSPAVSSTVTKHLLPDARNDDGLLSATVRAEVLGRPTA